MEQTNMLDNTAVEKPKKAAVKPKPKAKVKAAKPAVKKAAKPAVKKAAKPAVKKAATPAATPKPKALTGAERAKRNFYKGMAYRLMDGKKTATLDQFLKAMKARAKGQNDWAVVEIKPALLKRMEKQFPKGKHDLREMVYAFHDVK